MNNIISKLKAEIEDYDVGRDGLTMDAMELGLRGAKPSC